MTSPFNWRGPSLTGKALKPGNVNPVGKLPPIVLAGTPKWRAPKDLEKK